MRWSSHPQAVLLGLLVVHVLAHIDRNMLPGFSPQITKALEISNAQDDFNVFAIAIGNLPVIAAALFCTLAARGPRVAAAPQGVMAH